MLTALLTQALRKLIVLHTFGSHEIVSGRYPPAYARFADPYDNYILYNSALLRQWIGLLEGGDRPAALLCTSDHGLSMPPCSSDYLHGRALSSIEVHYLAWGYSAARARSLELFAPIQGEHSNALLALPDWPGSRNPLLEGKAWQALRCTLQ